jgi:uncharacterized protein YxeA
MKTEIVLTTIGIIIAVIIGLAAWAKDRADSDNNGYSDWEDDYYNDHKNH